MMVSALLKTLTVFPDEGRFMMCNETDGSLVSLAPEEPVGEFWDPEKIHYS
jgi:hypothetical protein